MSPPAVLVDTDVVAFLFKQDTRERLYRPHLAGRRLMIAFISLAELYRWAEKHRWGRRRCVELEQHLARFSVCEYRDEVCRAWARITTTAEREGRRMEVGDAWIAATALAYGLPLVTHNRRHYEGIDGLRIISEGP